MPLFLFETLHQCAGNIVQAREGGMTKELIPENGKWDLHSALLVLGQACRKQWSYMVDGVEGDEHMARRRSLTTAGWIPCPIVEVLFHAGNWPSASGHQCMHEMFPNVAANPTKQNLQRSSRRWLFIRLDGRRP